MRACVWQFNSTTVPSATTQQRRRDSRREWQNQRGMGESESRVFGVKQRCARCRSSPKLWNVVDDPGITPFTTQLLECGERLFSARICKQRDLFVSDCDLSLSRSLVVRFSRSSSFPMKRIQRCFFFVRVCVPSRCGPRREATNVCTLCRSLHLCCAVLSRDGSPSRSVAGGRVTVA